MNMKKSFISAAILANMMLSSGALAQSYNQGYYGGTPYYSAGYAQPGYNQGYYPQQAFYPQQAANVQKQRQMAETNTHVISPISIGADYVFGYASFENTPFTVPSALTDGNDYSSTTRSFERKQHSAAFNLGFRPFKHIGVEAFYQHSIPQNRVTHTESYSYYPEFARDEYEVNYSAYGIDLLGYMPLNDYIELIASIGVGKYDIVAKAKVVAYEDTSYTKLKENSVKLKDSVQAYRIGGGFQFWMSKHLALRIMGRWTKIGGTVMKYITEVNAGVRYHF